MKNSKLVQLLLTLNTNEWKQLNRYLQSPIVNENKDVERFCKYLHRYIAKGQLTKLSKESVFKYLYKQSAYDDSYMRQLMFNSLKTVEEFLVFMECKKDHLSKKVKLAEIYLDRNLEKHCRGVIRSIQKDKPVKTLNQVNPIQQYAILAEVQQCLEETSKPNMAQTYLQDQLIYQETAFLIKQMQIWADLLVKQNLIFSEEDALKVQLLLDYVELGKYINNPTIELYYYALRCFMNIEKGRSFFRLKAALYKHKTKLSIKNRQLLHELGRSFCVMEIEQAGNQYYLGELFELYQLALQEQLLLENGYLDIWTYTNITTIGLKLNAYDWVATFLKDYTKQLKETYSQAVYTYNYAKLLFSQEAFEEVMELLNQEYIKDMLMNISGKSMLMKAYYEQQETDILYVLLESFKAYLIKQKIIGRYTSNDLKEKSLSTSRFIKLNVYKATLPTTFAEVIV